MLSNRGPRTLRVQSVNNKNKRTRTMAQQHRCECDSNKWKILISHWMVSRQHFSFDSPPLAINEMEKREAHAHTSPQFKTISMSRCDEVIPFEGEIAIRLEQIQLLLAFQDQYNIVPSWLPPSSPLDRIDTVNCTQFSVKLSILCGRTCSNICHCWQTAH